MNNFDDIKPYCDAEIPSAMQRIADSEVLPGIVSYLDASADVESFRQKIRNIKTIDEFQRSVVESAVKAIYSKTTDGITYSGLENIDPNKRYLFISNHRDIVLDAMSLQHVLVLNGHKTCQITIGSNLMCHPFLIDFGKANKMFQIERGGPRCEFYNNLMHMSQYIRHLITEAGESVWIAQRNGRTKDGIDATGPTVIKMFGMSRRDDRVKALAELNIVPVSVAYEWESCDKLKTLELYASRLRQYEKKPGEDLNSILTGITQQKGRVHLHVCPEVTEDDLNGFNNGKYYEYYNNIAALIDRRINASYRLTPNNYIAHDLRSATTRFADQYTAEQKERFVEYMTWMDEYKDLHQKTLRDIFLGIYANSVDSRISAISE